MKIRIFFIIAIFFFGSDHIHAQKIIQKEFSAAGIQSISVVDDAIFRISARSSPHSSIKVELHISGEYSESIVLEENRSSSNLSLKTGFAPFFTIENDKLAAHKVMALELELLLPENLLVEIKSKLASVTVQGDYKNLDVSLQAGACTLIDFAGNAHLKTSTGNIKVLAEPGVRGVASSQSGTVLNSLSTSGKFFVKAESKAGNIYLTQTK